MSSFAVEAGDLHSAAQLVSLMEFGLFGNGGAGAAGTPVAAAWTDFVDAADGVTRGCVDAVGGLAGSLEIAGRVYAWADDSAAAAAAGEV